MKQVLHKLTTTGITGYGMVYISLIFSLIHPSYV